MSPLCRSLKPRDGRNGHPYVARDGMVATDGWAEKSDITVVDLARRVGVEMPICAATDAILNHGADISNTIQALLARRVTTEF